MYHCHSDYSLLDSCTKYQDYIDLAVRDGSKALSIDKPRVKILLLPLVFKRINIPKVYSSKENINQE